MWLLYRPSPRWSGEQNGKKKAKLMGRDKGSLTAQQRKWSITTIIVIRTREYTAQLSRCQCPARSGAKTNLLPPASSPTQHPAWWHMVSNTPFVWPVCFSQPCCVPSRLLVKINSIPSEPWTVSKSWIQL